MTEIFSDKAALRAHVRSLIAAADPADLACRSEAVFDAVERTELFAGAHTVALYSSLPDEPSTERFMQKWGRAKQLVLPCVEGDDLAFRRLTDRLNRGRFGIGEPEGETVEPGQIDLVVVPGVAFDASGRRLGRGRGYYDRFLALCPAPRIGVAFAFQLFDEIPHTPEDQPMTTIITR